MNRSAKYVLYSVGRRLMPKSMVEAISNSKILSPLVNGFLRPGGQTELKTGEVIFQDLRFQFCAPFPIFLRIQSRGLENIICKFVRTVLKKDSTAIDVGSNLGFISVMMALSLGPEGKVISIDPDPFYHELIERNIRMNNIACQWSLVKNAAGSKNDTGEVTLDNIVDAANIAKVDLIKIDTDGYDLNVLLGSSKVLKDRPALIVELTENQQEIYDLVRAAGYEWIVGMDGNPVVDGKWPLNLFACKNAMDIPHVWAPM